jgi:hypothetical protein
LIAASIEDGHLAVSSDALIVGDAAAATGNA